MKSAFLSDIHADIHSLKRVLRFLKSEKIKDIYCLGDIIGFGNYPNEVINLLNEWQVNSIRGNHERMLLEGIYLKKYNMIHTKAVLTDSCLEYLKGLSENIELKKYNAILSHAVPFTNDTYLYANSDFSIFDKIDYKIIFLGHTHRPMLMQYYKKKIINPGSVSQTRDGSRKSSFLICDLNDEHFDFIRI